MADELPHFSVPVRMTYLSATPSTCGVYGTLDHAQGPAVAPGVTVPCTPDVPGISPSIDLQEHETPRLPGYRRSEPAGSRVGTLSESVYGRAWHAARLAALGPERAATALARRPYDLRHAVLSLWLNASGAPAEVTARAGTSARVLHEVYLHCTGQDDLVSRRIEAARDRGAGSMTKRERRSMEKLLGRPAR
jgi:hypothetical protein